MSDPFQPVEPNVRPVSRPAIRRSSTPTVIALLALGLVIAAAAVVAFGRQPVEPLLAAGASSSPAPAATAGQPDQPDKAAKPDKGERGVGGVRGPIHITAISGDQISLATDDGWKRTISVTDATRIRKGGQDVAASALAVGDTVRLAQRKNDDGTYSVTAIHVPTPVTGGEVSAVGSSSLTLKQRGGATQTVTLTGDTTYTVGKEAGGKADVVVGARVTIEGTVSGSTFTAAAVHVRLEQVSGEVTAKTGSTITLTNRKGATVTVHVDADTTYRVRGKGNDATATLADIEVGARATARGTLNADGSIDASRVDAKQPKVKPTPTPGG